MSVESRNDGVGVESARILESLVRFSGGIKCEIRTQVFESREFLESHESLSKGH